MAARTNTFRNVMARVTIIPGGCWVWTGGTAKGYGQVGVVHQRWLVHRYVYTRLIGPIPEGLELGHVCHDEDPTCRLTDLCPHRLCCNPAHLRPMTSLENNRAGRGQWRRQEKNQCKYGHPLAGENLYIRPNGTRSCMECRRVRRRKSWHKMRSG